MTCVGYCTPLQHQCLLQVAMTPATARKLITTRQGLSGSVQIRKLQALFDLTDLRSGVSGLTDFGRDGSVASRSDLQRSLRMFVKSAS